MEEDVTPRDVFGRSRLADVARARHVAMFLAWEQLDLSYPVLAKAFLRSDHTTALHAVRKVQAALGHAGKIRAMVYRLRLPEVPMDADRYRPRSRVLHGKHGPCIARSLFSGRHAACGPECPVVYNINYALGARASARGRVAPTNLSKVQPQDVLASVGWADGAKR